MAARTGSQEYSPHNPLMFDFCMKFLRITGIRLPVALKPVGSLSKSRSKYFLKVTLLHGTEQQKIGDFEVIGEECIINHQLTCQIANWRPDVLAKLHVYIDQDWSAGLSGHITVDLKEFFEEVDAEVYLEYPLFSSGPCHASRTATLEMTVLCTCSTTKPTFSDHINKGEDTTCFEDLSKLSPSLDSLWYPPAQLDTESNHDAPSVLLDSVVEQVTPENRCVEIVDREIELLKEMEGQYRNAVASRPDVLAAVFFAAGMAFQRQVDSLNRLRMFRDVEDPLLREETAPLLLANVSPNFESSVSITPELREADTIRQSSSRSLVLSEVSTSSCGLPQSSSCSSEAATSCKSITEDTDDDENDHRYVDSPLCLTMSHQESELISSRNFNDTRPPVGESSFSKRSSNLVESEAFSQHKDRSKKNNVLNVVGSVLGAFAIVGLSAFGAKDLRSRGSKNEQVTVAGSMLGRQQVTSIQTIIKSNPGLGLLSSAMQAE